MVTIGNDRRKMAILNDESVGYKEKYDEMKHITLILCIHTNGGSVKQMAIFPLKTLPHP
jgi:hypothetical protein